MSLEKLSLILILVLSSAPSYGYEKTIEQTLNIYYRSLTACKAGKVNIEHTVLFSESKQILKPDSEVLPSDYEVVVTIDCCGVKGTYLAWVRYKAPWYTLLSDRLLRP